MPQLTAYEVHAVTVVMMHSQRSSRKYVCTPLPNTTPSYGGPGQLPHGYREQAARDPAARLLVRSVQHGERHFHAIHHEARPKP